MENRTVLFVDDEEKVLRSLKRGLMDEPYKTLFAESGNKALEILRQEEVDIIVTDMRMPEISGLQLLEIVKERYPHIIRMVLSGYTQITTLLTAINRGEIFRFITKPWKLEEEFKPAIRQAIDYCNILRERDKLMSELSQYNMELEEKVREKSEELLTVMKQAEIGKHASQIVHNLKSPLQSVSGFLELIDASLPKDNPAVDKLVKYTGQALSAMNDLKQMVVDILSKARKQGDDTVESININEVIRTELSLFEANPFFRNEIKKSIDYGANLPQIHGKTIHFKQVINNLITNAVDAMEDSNGTQLFLKTYKRGHDIVMDIVDTGEGIAPENIEKIFLPDFTTKPAGKGTGLGLASVKEMVEAYGGRIEVNSVKGQGSKFSVIIPAYQKIVAEVAENVMEGEKINV